MDRRGRNTVRALTVGAVAVLALSLAGAAGTASHPAAVAEAEPPVTSDRPNLLVLRVADPAPAGLPAPSVAPSAEPTASDPAPNAPKPVVKQRGSVAAFGLAANGIPEIALDAYHHAAAVAPCTIPWALLAAIGRVESNHGRFGGAVLYTDGSTSPRILGPQLNGNGTAAITDTDGGALDGDPFYDRAVGPMQFIPSTWAGWGVDASGDHVADPSNIYDATAAAARYLCEASGGDLTTQAGQIRGVFAYNHLMSYVRLVLALEAVYAGGGAVPVPGSHARPPAPPTLPPVNVGTPPAADKVPLPPEASQAPESPGAPTSSPVSSPVTTPAPEPVRTTPTPSPTPSPTSTPTPTGTPTQSGTPTPTVTDEPTCPPGDTASPSPTESSTEPSTPDPSPTASEPTCTPAPESSDPTEAPTPTTSEDPASAADPSPSA